MVETVLFILGSCEERAGIEAQIIDDLRLDPVSDNGEKTNPLAGGTHLSDDAITIAVEIRRDVYNRDSLFNHVRMLARLASLVRPVPNGSADRHRP